LIEVLSYSGDSIDLPGYFRLSSTRWLGNAAQAQTAMLAALALMLPGVAALPAAQLAASIPILITAAAICAVTSGLGYRGSLEVTNQIAPPDRRAEIASSYFICCFAGNALPVIGVGIIATYAGPPASLSRSPSRSLRWRRSHGDGVIRRRDNSMADGLRARKTSRGRLARRFVSIRGSTER
jgi:MFS family permease